MNTDQISLAMLAAYLMKQDESMRSTLAMLTELLDRVDMLADRTWRSGHLILAAVILSEGCEFVLFALQGQAVGRFDDDHVKHSFSGTHFLESEPLKGRT